MKKSITAFVMILCMILELCTTGNMAVALEDASNQTGISVTDSDLPKTLEAGVTPPAVTKLTNSWYGVTVSWETVSNYSYNLYRKEYGSYQWTKLTTTKANGFYDKTVVGNKKYTYAVSLVSQTKESSKGASKSILYVQSPEIKEVSNQTTGAKVTWAAVPGADGYFVYQKQTQNGTWHMIGSTQKNLYFNDTTVENGIVYYYAIKSFRKDGSETVVSASSSAKNTVYVKNCFVSKLTNPSSGTLKVDVSKNDKATGYEIVYGTSSTLSDGKTVIVSGTSKSFTGLTTGTYYVKVRAYKTVAGYTFYSAWSAIKNVAVSGKTPTVVPTETPTSVDLDTYMNSKYPDNMPKAVLVLPNNATAEEEGAAYILQLYILAEDGYRPEIIRDSVKMGSKGFEISLGNTNRPHGTPKYSSNDSYSIRSYTNGISITGVGQLGLMHGAMRFLEACGGFYFLSWYDFLVTNQDHFKVDLQNGISIDYERAFAFTDVDICYASLSPYSDITDPYYGKSKPAGYEPPRTGRIYSLAFGLNGFFGASYCLPKTEAGRETWYLSTKTGSYTEPKQVEYLAAGHAHTLLAEFLPASKYFKSHPEWYAAYSMQEMQKGVPDNKKSRTETQLCLYTVLHDKEAYGIILQHCYDMIAAGYDPNAAMQIISLSKNDDDKMCYCSKCMEDRRLHKDSHGGCTESIELVQLLNQVSKDLHKNGAYPNLYIDTLAYTWTLQAPDGVTCDDHVIIRWAPIDRCYGHYLDSQEDQRNKEYYPELVKWTKCCKHVWIWDYNTNFRTSILPYANVDVMQHDIKLYKSLGIEGVYLQSNDKYLQTNTEFGDIRNYIEGRMLQDPSRDYETELAFYLNAYYGKSAPYVKEYMERMEKQMKNHHNISEHRDELTNYNTHMYSIYAGIRSWNPTDKTNRMPDSEIGACEGLWQAINSAKATESAEIQARLTRLELGWRLVKSTLNVYEYSNPSTYASENQKLINDIKAYNKGDVAIFGLIGVITMDKCIYPQNHPDNWVYENDNVIGKFTKTNPGTTAKPTVITPKPLTSGSGTGTTTTTPEQNPTTTPEQNPTTAPEQNPTTTPEIDPYAKAVYYSQFGAKGDGKTDDYAAIVATHAYANEHNLPVKADKGAVYYVCKMNPKNPAGALVKTDTDWTGAQFIIDDTKMSLESGETKCWLFTVAPSEDYGEKFINFAGDNSLKLGLDDKLFDCPDHPTNVSSSVANSMKNKEFAAGTTKLQGTFREKALYILTTSSYKRWGRKGEANAGKRNQTEAIIVNTDGTIDASTPIQWPWKDIYDVKMFKIDNKVLTVKGGTFTTKANILNDKNYCYRGIHVTRSNVLMDGVEHYLDESYGTEEYPRIGAPYHGFFKLETCAYVTLRNCVFSEHRRTYLYGNDRNTTAPYDFYAEYACGITLENCKDATDIMDSKRWGTASNYCKSFTYDGCTLSRIDAHMGMYNCTVKNCTLGFYGIAAIGFGDLKIENTVSYASDAFLTFREDYGCAWDGDVYIKNCTWVCNTYTPSICKAINFYTEFDYGFEFDGQYYVHMANTINIDGFVFDVSSLGASGDAALYNTQFLQMFSNTFSGTSRIYNDEWLNDKTKNVYPIRPPKEVNLKNLTVIKHPNYKNKTLKVVLKRTAADVPNAPQMGCADADFYKNTKFNYDSASTKQIVGTAN